VLQVHVEGLRSGARAPEVQPPVAAAAHEVFTARLPREATDPIGVAAQHEWPCAFRTLAGEIPEHDLVAGARGEPAAVVAERDELDLAVVATHLGILPRRAVPEVQRSVGHAACEKP